MSNCNRITLFLYLGDLICAEIKNKKTFKKVLTLKNTYANIHLVAEITQQNNKI